MRDEFGASSGRLDGAVADGLWPVITGRLTLRRGPRDQAFYVPNCFQDLAADPGATTRPTDVASPPAIE